MKTKTNIIYPAFALFAFACFALAPQARATCQDACLTNNNTVQGDDALISLTTGTDNTGIGSVTLFNNTSGNRNTATGSGALFNNTEGERNTAIGAGALVANTTGSFNTATGDAALGSNTTGTDNTATGIQAMLFNTTGSFNTATGDGTLQSNTTGNNNTATGFAALINNTTGADNTATGVGALGSNLTGNLNTANGSQTLANNTTGSDNTATGFNALLSNTTGGADTANGELALFLNTTGQSNTATGTDTLQNNVTGNENTATGYLALGSSNGDHNTATGAFALLFSTGNSNIAVGYNAGANLTTGNNNIDIANTGVAGESSTIRIGTQGTQTATYIAGINGTPVSKNPVYVDSNGRLGVKSSSQRFKDEIKSMDVASEAILALKPVTFRYKKEIDPDRTLEFGLVAEEVAKVNPDLVVRDANGEIYAVRYDAVNAMLLNEFLKEHRIVQEQEAKIALLKAADAKQEAIIAKQQNQLQQLTAGLQRVSAQVEMSLPGQQIVDNRH